MNVRLRAQIIKELLVFLRDPRARLVLVGPPLLQLLVFSFAVTLEVRNVDVAVLDEDEGRASYELIARIGAASFVDELVPATGTADLARLIDERKVLGYDLASEELRERIARSKFRDYPGFGRLEEGHIVLQHHGTEAWFRRLRIETW